VTRALPDPGFAGDDGSPDPGLATALSGRAEGRTTDAEVLAALARARLLVPVVAIPVEGEILAGAGLRRGEKNTDMALVTLVGADGRRALPAFTSLATLNRWNPQARPVPVTAARAGQAALAENAELIVVDPGGPVTYLVEGPALRALAEGRRPVPPLDDPEVRAAVRTAVAAEPGLSGVHLLPGRGTDATAALVLAPGTGTAEARQIAARVAARLAEEPVLRSRLELGIDLAVMPPDQA